MKTLKEALLNERQVTRQEITDNIHALLSSCKNINQLKLLFYSLVNGLNEGLADMNAKRGDDANMCETASEIIEILQSTCYRLLK